MQITRDFANTSYVFSSILFARPFSPFKRFCIVCIVVSFLLCFKMTAMSIRCRKKTFHKTSLGFVSIHTTRILSSLALTTAMAMIGNVGVSLNGGFSPQIIHFNRLFHDFHHPFWGKTHHLRWYTHGKKLTVLC